MNGRRINLLFHLLLFLVFVLCALFTVLFGARVYENLNLRSEASYQKVVAVSYIANKVRQHDQAGMIALKEEENIPVLELGQTVGESLYTTKIYYIDGSLWELFSASDSGLKLTDGYQIMECGPVNMEIEDGLLSIKAGEEGSLVLSVRSEER
ncbi:MAG TPA: DUF4860 domain-containing protein [Candidatus Hungatella pullicola]|nr:DUF4860 domain-containing protein [Candidatus Hungatella pullicola]